jgi:rhodanese-related sulfurtransferase
VTVKTIHRATLQSWLSTGGPGLGEELALLDLREEAEFGKGHPLFATNVPLRRLRREVETFLPRKTVRTVLVDDGSGDAANGAAILQALGYSDVNILDGGIPAWLEGGVNGLPTFDIPGLIFSVGIADRNDTPSLTAADLRALYDEQADVIVLDTRTPEEFAQFHVPRARNVPGAEIVQRFLDYVPSPKTLVVVSCAGLPRAIIGAQSLIDAGVPNRVAYLVDGTAAWERAGFTLESGRREQFEPPSPAALGFAEAHVRALAARAGIRTIDPRGVADWLDDPARTTYLLDVRLPPEYAAGHIPGSVSAPGGQLLAVSHRTVAVRGARLVLIDDNGVRAITTAYWLRQRGWEVRVYDSAPLDGVRPRAIRALEPA